MNIKMVCLSGCVISAFIVGAGCYGSIVTEGIYQHNMTVEEAMHRAFDKSAGFWVHTWETAKSF